jgi:PAS domain S-box-containing protein
MVAGHDQRRPARAWARAEALIRAPQRSAGAVALAVLAGSLAQLGFALLWRSADTHGCNGITGVAGVLVPIIIAISAGRWAGAMVGLIGSVLFVVLVAEHAAREPVAGGAVVILLWTVVPFAVGVAFDVLRRNVSSVIDELESARDAAEWSEQATRRLSAFSRALAGVQTTAEAAQSVADVGAEACGARVVTVLAPAAKPGALRQLAVSALPPELLAQVPAVLAADQLVAATDAFARRSPVAVQGRAVIRRRYPATDTFWGDEQIEGIVALPIEFGELLGVISFAFADAQSAGDDRLPFLEELAHEAAEAFERARLLEAGDRGRERLEALVETSPLPVIAFDVEGVTTLWNAAAVQLYGWTASEALGRPVPLFDDTGRRLSAGGATGVLQGEALRNVPMRHRRRDGTVIDVLVTLGPLRGPDGAVQEVFGFAVDVTERAELERRTAEAHQRERTLRQIVEAALPQRDLDALLVSLVERVATTFDADRSTLLLLEDDVLRVRASHNLDPLDAADVRVPFGSGFAGRVAASRRPWVVGDLSQIEVVSTYLVRAGGSIAGVPLIVGDEVIGVLHVSSNQKHRFTGADVRLLEFVAERAAQAIKDSSLGETERSTAVELQRSLLPARLPDIPGAELVATYRPAVAGTMVGGDFYDVVAVGDDRWVIAVGDVAGKGPPAAALTAALRYTIRSSALRSDPLTETVRLASDALRETALEDERHFATLILAGLTQNGAAQHVELARAGHPPALVVRAGGRFERHEPEGSLLGLDRPTPITIGYTTLTAGDTIVLVTDGVTEAWPTEGGYEQAVATVVSQAGDDLRGAIDRLARAAAEQRSRADDIAIVVLRMCGG